jgi:hypothetical protein
MRPINEIYNDLYAVGVVNSQREMSLIMGKQPSWFSSSQTRKRKPTLDALTRGYVAISDIHRQAARAMEAADNDDDRDDHAAAMETTSVVAGEMWLEILRLSRRNDVAVWPAS